ncbi:MAG: DUF3160 domain-containing protein [Syntrophomonadaceae bacterium]|nr:DUF3160 domain-containing protein [Syntrophomonadaceae bacterium]
MQYKHRIVLLVLCLLTTLVFGWSCHSKSASPGPETVLKMTPATEAYVFAAYPDYPVNVQPAVNSYRVAADLSNVENSSRFNFSPQAKELLAKNGFVVDPSSWGEEFFMMYEPNRYDGIPNFVTTDAMLHNYHLFFDNLLERSEKEHLVPELKHLNQLMLNVSEQQYNILQGGPWENAAKRNLAFFTVGSRLVDPNVQIPAPVQSEVEQELALIEAHQESMALSPIMNMGQNEVDIAAGLKEDYTQYIPRGHYNETPELQDYFKAMMWYGRLNFRLKSEDETQSAVLITLALSSSDEIRKSWQTIYDPTCFFVGKSDDLGFYEYNQLLIQIYGDEIKLSELTGDAAKWDQFMAETKNLKAPALNSIPIFDESIQPDRENEIKGFRFLGQRYTLDADVFQRLIYREVKENPEGERRMLPKGLDIPAAMGSDEAYSILKELGDTRYGNYPENMDKMRSYISGLDKTTWTQNLYWSWLYTLLPLTVEQSEGYPSFMRNQAWHRKELNTYLGSWTELKHDTILYAKQVYAEAGGGGDIVDDRGYVEPNPLLYSRLASLAAMTREGLLNRGLLDERDAESLQRMQDLSLRLKEISEKELNGTTLSDADYELIRSFGVQLEHFWTEALRDKTDGNVAKLFDNPAGLIADVATDPTGTVLEEGTGYISQIFAVVPLDGKLRIVRGAVYSYYEFPWPASDRLTDEKWKEMLSQQQTPNLPSWTASFIAPKSR